MTLKNEAVQNLWVRLLTYNSCDPKSVINLFKECDEAIEGEIAALKAELHDANVSVDHLSSVALERGDKLSKANNQIESLKEDLKEANALSECKKKLINDLSDKLDKERKHSEDLADVNGRLASENVDLKAKTSNLRLLECSKNTWRARAKYAEKEVEDLNKKISDLEHKLTEQLEGSVTYQLISDLQKENEKLKDENIELNAQHDEDVLGYEELDEKYQAAMCEIRKLKKALEKAEGPKDLKFGDVIHVSWSGDDYMYIEVTKEMIRLYNITEKRLCYMAKHEHLTKIGECSFIPMPID